MARPIRIEFAGALYHITSRGDDRQDVFRDDQDRRVFLEILNEADRRFKWRCYAFCLMGNHYHLLVETPEPNLSAGMRHINGVYTQRFNRRHGRTGHVFQGRFNAILVDKESHFLEVCRYIVLNPVRAKFVGDPRAWRWSSYGATAGYQPAPIFLHAAELLRHFSEHFEPAQNEYRAWVHEGVNAQSPFDEAAAGLVLGRDPLVALCKTQIGHQPPDEATRAQRHLGRPSLEELFAGVPIHHKPARNAAIGLAYHVHGYTMKAIADHLDLHYSTISVALRNQ